MRVSLITNWRRLIGLRKNTDGATAVEFALTFPFYLGAIMFIMEMGRLAFIQGTVIHAAEEATRFALVNFGATATEIQENARDNLLGLDPANLTAILVTDPVDPTDQTKLITVEVQYEYEPLLPFLAFLSTDADGQPTIALSGASRGFITEEIPGI